MNKSIESRISFADEIDGLRRLNSVAGAIHDRTGRFLGMAREELSQRMLEMRGIARRIFSSEAPDDGGWTGVPREPEQTRALAYRDIHRSAR